MKIAVDAMGGDFAPQSIVEGVMYLFFFLKNKSDSQAVYYSSNMLKHQEELASFFVLMYLF